MLNKTEFQKTLDAFLKKEAYSHVLGTIKYISNGEKSSEGDYTYYDVVTYKDMNHGEQLGVMSTVVLDKAGAINQLKVWDHNYTVGSNTLQELLKRWNSIPEDEIKLTSAYKARKNKNLKETITDVVSEANVTYSFTQDEYDTNYKQYTSGKMTKDEWIKYSTALLSKIMKDNKDVLVRLKNR